MIFHQPHNSAGGYNYNAFFYEKEIWEPHFHKNFELIFVVSGSIVCTVNGKVFTLKENEFGLCLPYDIHSIKPADNSRYWVMVFSSDYIRTFAKQISGKRALDFSFTCQNSVREFLLSNLINAKSPSVYLIKACLYAALGEFKESVSLCDSKEAENIGTICLFLEKHHTEDISLKSISKLLGYDYNYVSRYFNSVFNMSFTDFLNLYRLQTALSLLEEENKKIADIALESGFKSVRNFNCFFKKSMGLSPTEYKKSTR